MLPISEIIIRTIATVMIIVLILMVATPVLLALGILIIAILGIGLLALAFAIFIAFVELCWEISKDVFNTVTNRW